MNYARIIIMMSSQKGGIFVDITALILLVVGGLNWGLVGIFGFDLVAWLFGGSGTFLARTVYIIIALAACWGISMFFRRPKLSESV